MMLMMLALCRPSQSTYTVRILLVHGRARALDAFQCGALRVGSASAPRA